MLYYSPSTNTHGSSVQPIWSCRHVVVRPSDFETQTRIRAGTLASPSNLLSSMYGILGCNVSDTSRSALTNVRYKVAHVIANASGNEVDYIAGTPLLHECIVQLHHPGFAPTSASTECCVVNVLSNIGVLR